MKNKAYLMAMSLAVIMESLSSKDKFGDDLLPNKDVDLARNRRYIDNMKKKGIKEFNIDGKIVYARDLKNAQRKAKNL